VTETNLPPDYYERLYAVEQEHWWHRGMRSLTRTLLGEALNRNGQAVLDAGCGTGGFLRWLLGTGCFTRACGVDVSDAAIELARQRVPEAELAVAPLRALPFEDESFDLVVLNDVLQHVDEREVEASLGNLRRVLRADGTLFVRTNGAAQARAERSDWRVYDRRTLTRTLTDAGFVCERVTYANMLGAAWAQLRLRRPRAPTGHSHGIPAPVHPARNLVGAALLGLEEHYLRAQTRTLPFGHTLLAVAHRRGPSSSHATCSPP
jgi:ubiquinone/menaquinone biosynthesis C-methylase UbiE